MHKMDGFLIIKQIKPLKKMSKLYNFLNVIYLEYENYNQWFEHSHILFMLRFRILS